MKDEFAFFVFWYKSPIPERRKKSCLQSAPFTSNKGLCFQHPLNWTRSVFPLLSIAKALRRFALWAESTRNRNRKSLGFSVTNVPSPANPQGGRFLFLSENRKRIASASDSHSELAGHSGLVRHLICPKRSQRFCPQCPKSAIAMAETHDLWCTQFMVPFWCKLMEPFCETGLRQLASNSVILRQLAQQMLLYKTQFSIQKHNNFQILRHKDHKHAGMRSYVEAP